MTRMRRQIRQALAERDTANAMRAFRLDLAGRVVDGRIALPVAEAWLTRRQAVATPPQRGKAADLIIVDDPIARDTDQ